MTHTLPSTAPEKFLDIFYYYHFLIFKFFITPLIFIVITYYYYDRGLECKIGSQETPGVTGKFGLGIRNEAGKG